MIFFWPGNTRARDNLFSKNQLKFEALLSVPEEEYFFIFKNNLANSF